MNIIIYANTNISDFDIISDRCFYYFHRNMMICGITMFGSCIVFESIGVKQISKNIMMLMFQSIIIVGIIVIIGIQYWQLGILWQKYPEHTIMFYPEFWNSGLSKFNNTTAEHWPYVMSDVVVRIESFCLMSLAVILGFALFVFVLSSMCKLCQTKPREYSTI